MWKEIKDGFVTARKFHLQMRILGAIKKDEKVLKLGITKKQIEILYTCAQYGFKDADDLIRNITHVQSFNQRRENGSTKKT